MSSFNKTNPFTLGQVLSITSDRLMCDIEGVYAILNHMTGQSLFTHQLPMAQEKCQPLMCDTFPALAAVDLSHVTRDNWMQVLYDLIVLHGNAFEVPKMNGWVHSDPVESAVEMFGRDRVIEARA